MGLSVRCIRIGFHIIQEPERVHFAQINFGGVFEDEAADILIVDQIAVAVLLLGLVPYLGIWLSSGRS